MPVVDPLARSAVRSLHAAKIRAGTAIDGASVPE
jgi:hypothetical protein